MRKITAFTASLLALAYAQTATADGNTHSRHLDDATIESTGPDRQYNPILPDLVADPSVSKFDGVYYLYGTTDIGGGLGSAGLPVVWHSTDFVDWSFDGTHLLEFDWNKPYTYVNDKGEERTGYYRYWAPGKVIERDGTYYLYPTIVTPDDHLATYVMTSNSPLGPFRFWAAPEGSTDFLDGMEASMIAPDIDGEPFVDDNGEAYLFWRRRMAARMDPSLTKLATEPVEIRTHRKGYSEGPFMFKRDGIYYYCYTLSGHQNYVNAYMMSRTSPLEGFETPAGEDIFIYSSPRNGVLGPGHGNAFYDPDLDQYIIVYLEYGLGGTTRQVYANRLTFNADGTIATCVPDQVGVGPLSATTQRADLAGSARYSASSVRQDIRIEVDVETQPNHPLPDKGSVSRVTRQRTFAPSNVADRSNATSWQPAEGDTENWIVAELPEPTYVSDCEVAFVNPTGGHAWTLERSVDCEVWATCHTQADKAIKTPHTATVDARTRYLRVRITDGTPGIYYWRIHQ